MHHPQMTVIVSVTPCFNFGRAIGTSTQLLHHQTMLINGDS